MENDLNKGLVVEAEPNAEDIRLLEESISAFNVQATGLSRGRLFGIFMRDVDGTAIGGVHGWTYGKTCYIRSLFVPAHLRNQGHGTRLVHAVQAEARDRGCNQMVLQTFDFQAPEFYRGRGFEIIARVPDYPHQGHESIIMVKRLGS